MSGKARVKGRGSGSLSTTAVVAEQSSGSDVIRRALSGDSGWWGAVDRHNNNANEYYGKWLRTLTPLDWLLQPLSGLDHQPS